MNEKLNSYFIKYPNVFCLSDPVPGARNAVYGPLSEEFLQIFENVETMKPGAVYDEIFAPLLPTFLSREHIVSSLFNLYDGLKKGGRAFISFASLERLELVKSRERALYWDSESSFSEWRYRIDDVATALSTLGFVLTEMEKSEVDDTVFISLVAVKK
jgi:hypothetical protein